MGGFIDVELVDGDELEIGFCFILLMFDIIEFMDVKVKDVEVKDV